MLASTVLYLDDTAFRTASGKTAIEDVRKNFPLEREAEDLITIYRMVSSKPADPPLTIVVIIFCRGKVLAS